MPESDLYCPNCTVQIKTGILSNNRLLTKRENNIIQIYRQNDIGGYCQKCGNDLLNESSSKIKTEIEHSRKLLDKYIVRIPVVTTHSPHGWDYRTIGIVTGQSTMGTGVLTELTSSITDAFGVSSGRHNTKLKKGEDMCLAQLKTSAFEMGANAIIGTDIDYSEIGSGKGILMVCMAGTAVKLLNTEVLDKKVKAAVDDIPRIMEKLRPLEKLTT